MKLRLHAWVIFFVYFLTTFYQPLIFAAPAEGLSDEEFLELVQRKSFDFFITESNPANGLVKDRAHNFKKGGTLSASSIASVGFALTAYAIGVERNWIDAGTARLKTIKTLRFFLEKAQHMHGFYYHFLDMNEGKRASRSEISPIDTALFLAGVLFAAEYYEDPEIRDLAMKIYERIEWPWLLHGGKTLAMSFSPENGFSKYRWDHYNESLMMYLMAIGSPTHPLPASSWQAVRKPVGSYKSYKVIQMPPLFTHQYSHIWIDFRDKNDGFADYFKNSVNATLANRQFAIDEMRKFKTYGPDSWGLTASDGPSGYKAYGAPPGWANHDGTVAPTACGGSIVFTPKESMACLRNFYDKHKDRLWGRYGFADAFNLERDWVATDVIGIDQGTILLMIENYRSELIWKVMSKNVYLQKAMQTVGFVPGTKDLPWPDPPAHAAPYLAGGLEVDGFLKDWPKGESLRLNKKSLSFGEILSAKDLGGELRFAWDENYLYFYAKVKDDTFQGKRTGRNIWMDDAVEIFIDPENDGLFWQNNRDFQLGFRARAGEDGVDTWSWFQSEDPAAAGKISAKGYVHEGGYLIEGAIRWDYLGIRPEGGLKLNLSPAIHDIDRDRSESKMEWFFRNEEEFQQFRLGTVELKP